jgi:YesN/AraC family two-component response regulator
VLYYLEEVFSNDYNVITANNGKEAYEIAIKEYPDIIISDVMMPEMNGFELCDLLKTNNETSHIPIILLTAKTEDENMIFGFDLGADAYIKKPFNEKVLLSRVENLLEQRELIREKYKTEYSFNPELLSENEVDKQFIKQVVEIIKSNFSNEKFSVDELTKPLNISRAGLFSKIKKISGFSPNDFVNDLKMKEAKRLLQEGNLNVSEVCYALGFKTPKYFSKLFKEKFKVNPSDFISK